MREGQKVFKKVGLTVQVNALRAVLMLVSVVALLVAELSDSGAKPLSVRGRDSLSVILGLA
jgi:hypothetical protein